MAINLSKLSRKDIDALLKDAAARLKELEHETVGAFVEDVKKRAHKAGISLQELAERLGGTSNGATTRARAPRAKQADKRSKVAVKYRNPATGETWSGRGIKARWLANAIAAGKKLEDFLIGGAAKPAIKVSVKARSSAMKGRKVAAKYKHPKSGDTWSGRGSKPRWLQAELKAGKKIEAFAVK